MSEQLRELHLFVVEDDRVLVAVDGALPVLRLTLADDDTTVQTALRGISSELRLDVPLLEIHFDYTSTHDDEADGSVAVLVVTESPPAGWDPPVGMAWQALDGPDPAVHPRLHARFDELLAERRGQRPIAALRPRWAMPGWHARAAAWIDGVLDAAERPRTGPIEQVRHWGISALMRVPTDGGRLWFKAVFPRWQHEPAVTALLHRVAAGTVAPVVGHEDHEGWLLLEEVAGTSAKDTPQADDAVISSLIAIQHRFLERLEDLEAAGAPARPFSTVAEELASWLADPEIRAWVDITDERVDQVVRAVAAAAGDVAALGIPDALVHGDFHPDNVLVSDGPPAIIDWSDAAIAHPLVDSLTWMGWVREDPDRAERAWTSFRDGWAGYCAPEALDAARRALTTVTAAYHTVSFGGILHGMEQLRRPELADGLQHYLKLVDEAAARYTR